jgi:hypothetical protein
MIRTFHYLMARMVLANVDWYRKRGRAGQRTIRKALWYGLPRRKHWWRA